MTAPVKLPGAAQDRGRDGVYARPLLWMLALAYACNFMDRSVIATLAQAIKTDLLLSDGQLGLLQGFAFVVLYCLMGLPMAWLAERRNRISLISICLVVWSGMTMVCGLAQNFVHLLLARIGVGVGEAGCNPCSHSMIADTFDAGQRSRALSIYQLGATAGTMLGAILAGQVAQHFGWRAAFVAVGIPGIVVALAMKLTMKDPPRRPDTTAGATQALADPLPVLKWLLRNRAIIHLELGFTLASFAYGAISGFNQPYFIRAFGLTVGEIGLIFGISSGLASATCLIVSGWLTDRCAARGNLWYARLAIIGMLCALPAIFAAYTVGDWRVAAILTFVSGFFMNWFIIPSLSLFHKLLGVRRVATGMTLLLMFQNFLGLGAGPFAAGLVIDAATRSLFASTGHGAFAAQCPGGQAIAGAGADMIQACHAALLGGTRIGLLASIAILVWACLHYFIAGRLVARAAPDHPFGPQPRYETGEKA